MKEGWEYKKLGEICRVINGRAYSKDEMLNQGKYRLLRVGNFFTNDSWYYSDLELEEDKYCDNGDLLYAWSASFGPRIWNGEKVIYHYHIWKMVCSEEIDKFFLCYWLDSDELKKQTMTNLHGATMAHITKRIIENAIVSYPSLSEQQSIVDYLDSAFAKIDAMKANAEKALNEAKALFQASLKEMLEPKEGWEEKKLGDVGTFIRGGNFSKKDFVEDGYPCIHYGQIHTKFGVATFEHLSCVPETMVKKERCASKGDLVIAITSEDDEGSCKCTAWMADYEAYVGGHTAIFKHSLNPLFVSYYFKASRFQKAKLEYTHGFKVVEISPKDIAKIPISYPSLSEQQSIVATLDSLKSKVDRLQANFDKISQECDALKQAILRQVFE